MPRPLLVPDITPWLGAGDIRDPHVSRGHVVAVTVGGVRIVQAGAWGWTGGTLPVRDVQAALERWAEGLWRSVDAAGVPPADTPPGVALAILRQAIDAAGARLPVSAHHARRSLRAAYRGGYVGIPYAHHHGAVIHVDRNSAYPAQIRQGIPAGYVPDSGSDIRPDGIYRATVWIPELWLPPLTVRLPGGATGAPVGTVTGVFVGCELLFALELGAKIEKIYNSWAPTKKIELEGPIDTLYRVRKGAYGRWAKIVLNSLAGLMGRREFVRIYKIGEIPRGWRAASLEGLGGIDIAYREVWAPSQYSQPGGAAWVTASARVELLRLAYKMGPENILYLDTDALIVVDNQTTRAEVEKMVGEEMGAWKIEHQAVGYSCRALRQIRFGDPSPPPTYPSGALLCGRLSVGSGSVPATIDELVRAEKVTHGK